MTKRAVEPGTFANDIDYVASAEILIARIAVDHRAGRNISKDLRALVMLAGPDQAIRDQLARAAHPGTGAFEFECSDGSERVKLQGAILGVPLCAATSRADIWIHSQSLDVKIRWKEQYRCVGHETIEDPEFGTLQVMSLR